MQPMMVKILVIGAGPTSALLTAGIRKCGLADIDLQIWERNSSVGGRFQSFSGPKNGFGTADLGAQYLTRSHGSPWSKPYFDELISTGLLKELNTSSFPGFRQDETKTNFVCPRGTGSIVEHYFRQANVSDKIKLGQTVSKIRMTSNSRQGIVASTDTGVEESFDILISTVPAPNLLAIDGIGELAKGTSISDVKYTSRFALGLFFHEKLQLESKGNDRKMHRAMNFVQSPDSVVRYWAIENLKRAAGDYGLANRQFPAIVVHTSVDYGAKNKNADEDTVKNPILQQLKAETDLVADSDKYSVICHKWNCSQVSVPYPNSPGYLVLNKSPLILASGDSFTNSGFEGCIKSAEETLNCLKLYIDG